MGVPRDVDMRSLCSQAVQAISEPFQIMIPQKKRPAAARKDVQAAFTQA